MSAVYYTRFESPVGPLLLAGDAKALRRVSFESSKHSAPPQPGWKLNRAPFSEVIRQLQAYFRGELKRFDVPLAMEGTEFQLRVWNELRTIPYGEKRFLTHNSRGASETPKPYAPWDWRTGAIRFPLSCRAIG